MTQLNILKANLKLLLDDLRTDVGPGRLTKGAVYGLLARLHLNAAVWRDPYADQL